MGNWVVRQNNVYDNNLPNPAPEDSFQGALPSGVGILLLGVYDNVVEKNTVENNDFVGIGVLGWCSATASIPEYNCGEREPITDPSVNNNIISQNKVSGNGSNPPGDGMGGEGPLDFLAADLTYFSLPFLPVDDGNGNQILVPTGETSSGNCFKKNKPAGYSFFSSEPDGELPTDGC
jgi:hypothetical protein